MNILYNIRCPLCGDSRVKPSSKRGYIFEANGGKFYVCHNKTLLSSCDANNPININNLSEYQEIAKWK